MHTIYGGEIIMNVLLNLLNLRFQMVQFYLCWSLASFFLLLGVYERSGTPSRTSLFSDSEAAVGKIHQVYKTEETRINDQMRAMYCICSGAEMATIRLYKSRKATIEMLFGWSHLKARSIEEAAQTGRCRPHLRQNKSNQTNVTQLISNIIADPR